MSNPRHLEEFKVQAVKLPFWPTQLPATTLETQPGRWVEGYLSRGARPSNATLKEADKLLYQAKREGGTKPKRRIFVDGLKSVVAKSVDGFNSQQLAACSTP